MKFFCGVNGSSDSLAAVALAARLTGPGDRFALYYSPPRIAVPDQANRNDGLEAALRERLVKAVFDEALSALPADLLSGSETLVGTLRADAALLAAAEQASADVIVLGARGGGTAESRSLGSTVQAVVRAATLPVLIARPSHDRAQTGPLRVLLAVDETPASRQAAQFAGNLSFPAGSSGKLMSVVPRPGSDVPKWAEVLSVSPQAAEIRAAFDREQAAEVGRRRELLAELAREGGLPKFAAEPPLVREGIAAEEILNVVERERFDLLVLGARRRGAWSRFFLGSVSDAVLSCADCSVLIVRERAAW